MSDLYLSHLTNWTLSSPPAEWAINRLRELLIGALSQGAIPKHVAFEMDGNRRYARSHKIETIEGHHLGFEALARVLEICYKCGVKVVTVYAFSIENYNRPKYEVEGLMQLAKAKLEQLVKHDDLLERYGASVRVLGQRDLVRPDVLEVIDQAVDNTKHNKEEEIASAVRSTVEEYSTTPRPHSTPLSQSRIQKHLSRQNDSDGPLLEIRETSPAPSSPRSEDVDDSASSSATLHPGSSPPPSGSRPDVTIYPNAESITSETLDSHMYTAGCPPLDMFIRTSGVERLSDFMLWQCHQDTQIFFLKCFWPEFDLWQFIPTAKPPAPEGSSSSNRRSQPVRQTRTNPSRTTVINRNNPLASGPGHEQPIDIFPAVTHFADSITALPKELVRHFTLLKEVDAKIFAPEEGLFKLIDAALNAPPPDPARSHNDASSSIAPNSAPMSAQNSNSGTVLNSQVPPPVSTDESINTALFDPSNLPRRQLFRQTAFKIQEMLVSLEEKNHVISTANDALQKQLARIDDVWPHLEGEFSDEAKWGSSTHWAYLENRIVRSNNTQAERSRREGAATLSAAAQQLAEEAAARSNDRKQALAAKKNSRNQGADADADGKQQEQPKKSQSNNKSRKPAPDNAAAVGLGISTAGGPSGNPPSKRRKVENKTNGGGAPMERAMSNVFGANAPKPKTTSPRETPAPDGASKKRKALPTSSNQSKKSRTGAAMSPSVASSPVLGNFPDVSKPVRSSPAPSTATRPASSRARQNSTQSNVENGRPRPSPPAPNKPNGNAVGTPDVVTQSNGGRATNDSKPQKENSAPSKPEVIKTENEVQVISSTPVPNGSKKETTAKATEENEAKRDSATPVAPPVTAPAVMTKSGRASKPSTPALATFAEAATARSRPSRALDSTNPPVKRSHKKGASAAAAAAMAVAAQQAAAEEDQSAQDDEEEADIDGDEPRYSCDADGCKREWFHLECVGLKVAPKGNAKWYCEDCKKRLRIGGKAPNGR
ncbi:putative undecaprenyl diphosphate synthase-domain-containing protein [Phialemonium atrogriseum]|uniref:Undecaprenyl diphosphate synthase-domain-containing protein n=1 Tax=Phialemonium atrogriseum TaxID=1093897 RepID=A0AAJ0FUB9_9PEZI|nr:putative undecaprenyl diphosphate synthase-domain-containing protein [Phialemonium atrogriseum]KAK1772980.1 putative undecaprenyl diphosphate synthase-domain-containing protein [Phialemonium atrogriseum]